MKGLGWTDPDVWNLAQQQGVKISVEDMQNARTLLNKKRQEEKLGSRETAEGRALRLLQAIYERTHDSNQPVVSEFAPELGLSEKETEAAWRYLSDKNLIKTFNLPFTARINLRA